MSQPPFTQNYTQYESLYLHIGTLTLVLQMAFAVQDTDQANTLLFEPVSTSLTFAIDLPFLPTRKFPSEHQFCKSRFYNFNKEFPTIWKLKDLLIKILILYIYLLGKSLDLGEHLRNASIVPTCHTRFYNF